jgi:hypothetical protein
MFRVVILSRQYHPTPPKEVKLDVRNLIFPMTAGDLVQSALVLCQVPRGDGPDLRLCEVTDVQRLDGPSSNLKISFSDTATFDQWSTVLKPDTPLLITGISRS